jgi:hypothetical protein
MLEVAPNKRKMATSGAAANFGMRGVIQTSAIR